MKENQFWLYAHPKIHPTTQQLIKSQLSRKTRRKIYVTIARNLDIGHETTRRKQQIYNRNNKPNK
jgi:DNA replication protein DnaD